MGITHSTVVLTADDGSSEVGTDEWNAAHTIDTLQVPSTQGDISFDGFAASLQVVADSGLAWPITQLAYSTTGQANLMGLGLTRGADVATHGVVSSGDTVGGFIFYGSDGTNWRQAGKIACSIDGTPGASDMPGRLTFHTTADGAASPTERMRIDSAGKVLVGTATSTVGALLTVASGTLTANAPALDISQTWNATATGSVCTAIKLNVTNTLSAATSLLMDFQVDGASRAAINRDGRIQANPGNNSPWGSASDPDFAIAGRATGIYSAGSTSVDFTAGGTTVFGGDNNGYFYLGAASTLRLYTDANHILAQRNDTTAQTFRVYNTYTDSSNYERAAFDWTTQANVLRIGAQAAGTGTLRPVRFCGSLFEFFDTSVLVSIDPTAAQVSAALSGNSTILDGSVGLRLGSGLQINWRDNVLAGSGSVDTGINRNAAGIVEVNNGTAGTYRAAKMSALYRTGIRTVTADFAQSANDTYIIVNKSSTASCTLMSATGNAGLELYIKTIAAQSVISGGTGPGVVPLAGGATASAIVAATAGKYAKLVSDGASWHIMEAN